MIKKKNSLEKTKQTKKNPPQSKIISLYIITIRLGTLTELGKILGVRHRHFHLYSAANSDFEGRYYKSLRIAYSSTLYFWPQHSSLYFKSSVYPWSLLTYISKVT